MTHACGVRIRDRQKRFLHRCCDFGGKMLMNKTRPLGQLIEGGYFTRCCRAGKQKRRNTRQENGRNAQCHHNLDQGHARGSAYDQPCPARLQFYKVFHRVARNAVIVSEYVFPPIVKVAVNSPW